MMDKLTFNDKDTIRKLLIIEKEIYRYYKQLSFNLDDFEARAELKELLLKESKIVRSLDITREKYNLICEFIISIYSKPIDVNIPTVINPLINGDEFLKKDNYHFYRLISKCHKEVLFRERKDIELIDAIKDLEVALLYRVLMEEIEKKGDINNYFIRLLNMYSFNTLIDASNEEYKMLTYNLECDQFIKDALYKIKNVLKISEMGVDDDTILCLRKNEFERVLALLAFHIKNNPQTYMETSRYYFLLSYIKVLVALSPIDLRMQMYARVEEIIIEKSSKSEDYLTILYDGIGDIENNIVPQTVMESIAIKA